MTERVQALDVWVHKRRVGRVEALRAASPVPFSFTYGQQISENEFISLSMKVQDRPFTDRSLFPIFEQNLPEGELRAVLGTRYSKLVTLIDDFDYLAVCGPYWRGRVRLSEIDGEPKQTDDPLPLSDLLATESRELFSELVERYGFQTATRSGVQPKLALTVDNAGDIQSDRRATLWTENKIVKFENDDTEYPGIAINEYVSMTAAKASGIPVPDFEISDDGKRFIIDRFDQTREGADLGFEEAATLMLFSSSEKYGSSYNRMCRILLDEVTPLHLDDARTSLVKQLLLMTLIGNGDAHLKNFGVVYSDADDVRLAPAYDIVCTTDYLKKDLPALGFKGRKIWFRGDALITQISDATGADNNNVAMNLKEVQEGIEEAIKQGLKRFRGNSTEIEIVKRLSDHWHDRMTSPV